MDTLGRVRKALVHSAAIQDRAAVPLLLAGLRQQLPRIEHGWLDQGSTGSGKQWLEEHLGWRTEIVQPPRTWERGFRGPPDPTAPHGIRWEIVTVRGKRGVQGVVSRRWAEERVERTFAWLLHSRRLCRDYERLTSTDEALVYATMTRLLAHRLATTHG